MRAVRPVHSLLSGLAVAAGLVATPGAFAADLVVNGGFETGDLSGWFGSARADPLNGAFCPGAASVSEGICAGFFGAIGGEEILEQTLSTQPGVGYLVSFALKAAGDAGSSFSAWWGGQPLYTVGTPDTAGAFTTYSFVANASAADTVLSFRFRDDPGFLFLDAVSVVPEPASTALLSIGLALLGTRLARKRRECR